MAGFCRVHPIFYPQGVGDKCAKHLWVCLYFNTMGLLCMRHFEVNRVGAVLSCRHSKGVGRGSALGAPSCNLPIFVLISGIAGADAFCMDTRSPCVWIKEIELCTPCSCVETPGTSCVILLLWAAVVPNAMGSRWNGNCLPQSVHEPAVFAL